MNTARDQAKGKSFIQENRFIIVILLALGFGYLLFKMTSGASASIADLERSLASGQPTVLEVYSETWGACIASRPIVDELEKDMNGIGKVVRIDAYSSDGQAAGQRYGVYGVPTFIVFSGAGVPTYRYTGVLDKKKVLAEVMKAANLRTNWGGSEMPIYEYKCRECGAKFQKLLRSFSATEVKCSECGSEQTEKMVSNFAANGLGGDYCGPSISSSAPRGRAGFSWAS